MTDDQSPDCPAGDVTGVLDVAQLRRCLAQLRACVRATGGRVDVTIHGASEAAIAVLSMLEGSSTHPAYWESTEWDAVRVNFGAPAGEMNAFSRVRARRGGG